MPKGTVSKPQPLLEVNTRANTKVSRPNEQLVQGDATMNEWGPISRTICNDTVRALSKYCYMNKEYFILL